MTDPQPRDHLVVVCDLGPSAGTGHAMRCIALAEEFAVRGFEVTFVADVESVPFVRDQLAARGFGAVPTPPDVAGHLDLLSQLSPHAVVIDSYVLPLELYEAVMAAHPTLALVDGDVQGRTAHLYVDQNLGAEDDTWVLAPGSRRLAGLDYALLRDDVLSLRPDAPDAHPTNQPANEPPRLLAVFGGTDAFGAGPVAVQALIRTGLPFEATLVAGHDGIRAKVAGLEPGDGQHLDVIAPTPRLAELVSASDLVVSASGTSSWELLCLGAACAMVCVADNQLLAYGRLVETGAVRGLGLLEDLRHDDALAVDVLSDLLADAGARTRMRGTGWRLVDGRGKVRVAEALIEVAPLL